MAAITIAVMVGMVPRKLVMVMMVTMILIIKLVMVKIFKDAFSYDFKI